MLGRLLKGCAWTSTFALTTLGALTFVPDDAWRSFPKPLSSVRAALARIGVAPIRYLPEAVGFVPSERRTAREKGGDLSANGTRSAVRIGPREDAFGSSFALKNALDVDVPSENVLRDDEGRESKKDDFPVFSAEPRSENLAIEPSGSENWDDWANGDDLELDGASGSDASSASSEVETGDYPASDEIPPFHWGDGAEDGAAPPSAEPWNLEKGVESGFEVAANDSQTPAPILIPETGARDSVEFELERALQEAEELDAARRNSDAALLSDDQIRQTKDLFLTLNRARRARGAALGAEKAARLNDALDRLAFEVFYNPKNAILEPFYVVATGDVPASVAAKFDVTPETLAAINGLNLAPDAPLPAGATLKTVRGPVAAEISASKRELLLTFDGLYAGRFSFGAPERAAGLRGKFVVSAKIGNPTYHTVDASGNPVAIPSGAPGNPLGVGWIALDPADEIASSWSGSAVGFGLQGTDRPELVGTVVAESAGLIFSDREIAQLSVLLPIGASVVFVD